MAHRLSIEFGTEEERTYLVGEAQHLFIYPYYISFGYLKVLVVRLVRAARKYLTRIVQTQYTDNKTVPMGIYRIDLARDYPQIALGIGFQS